MHFLQKLFCEYENQVGEMDQEHLAEHFNPVLHEVKTTTSTFIQNPHDLWISNST